MEHPFDQNASPGRLMTNHPMVAATAMMKVIGVTTKREKRKNGPRMKKWKKSMRTEQFHLL